MEAMNSRDEMEAQASEKSSKDPTNRYIFDAVGEVRMYVHQQKVQRCCFPVWSGLCSDCMCTSQRFDCTSIAS
jgi:hypothetical protein